MGFLDENPGGYMGFNRSPTYTGASGIWGLKSMLNSIYVGLWPGLFIPIAATGGTITTIGNYRYHAFTSSGTFNITKTGTLGEIDYIVVGGGGGGIGLNYSTIFPNWGTNRKNLS